MSASVTLLILASCLFAVGIYIMMQRNLTRILLGFLLVGNGVNIFIFLMSGRPGDAPITPANGDASGLADPVPQAFILTAIVINFGITAFLLALIYRSWWLAQLGEDGDTVSSDQDDDDENSAQVFEQSHDEDDAIQEALDASDDEDNNPLHEPGPNTGPIGTVGRISTEGRDPS
ncbi:NADH-quinone oxidoreductase subunit K [Lysinibacter cavernae]|uniref:Multicomponent Na+:H+ antiporter subunit C n=1 Tax=Lysinibacter cavernae TaxID=1640652 RepID=A0A7X5TTN6_9MICO|nr:NADH-quinone oxidoreductase subunit K [Lysinibacter cavernae]NIH53709.1 multicomponent Na+:H+ antiporter subunit C [Lysinibacter cavernae]